MKRKGCHNEAARPLAHEWVVVEPACSPPQYVYVLPKIWYQEEITTIFLTTSQQWPQVIIDLCLDYTIERKQIDCLQYPLYVEKVIATKEKMHAYLPGCYCWGVMKMTPLG